MNDTTEHNNVSASGGHLGPDNAQTGPDYDPVNLMSQVFVDISKFLGPAHDILLSWLLRLPRSVPPAEAAQKVLDEIARGSTEGASKEGIKLIDLLGQTAEHNMENILSEGYYRRRGGRSARFRD